MKGKSRNKKRKGKIETKKKKEKTQVWRVKHKIIVYFLYIYIYKILTVDNQCVSLRLNDVFLLLIIRNCNAARHVN